MHLGDVPSPVGVNRLGLRGRGEFKEDVRLSFKIYTDAEIPGAIPKKQIYAYNTTFQDISIAMCPVWVDFARNCRLNLVGGQRIVAEVDLQPYSNGTLLKFEIIVNTICATNAIPSEGDDLAGRRLCW